jgi:UDP-glucose 4-epimerase
MDFIYVKDVAGANLLAAQSDISDDVFNLGTGVQTSLNELCDMVLRLTGSSLKPEYRGPRRVAHVQRRRADVERVAGTLGFRAAVALEDGLREFIDWRRKALAGCRAEAR